MPFDSRILREPPRVLRDRRLVGGWLLTVCFMLLVMIALGGATRLTGSGLSIMEWAPLSGVVPPLSHAEWERLFGLYQDIPQYRLLHEGMDLAGFQQIFWLEWVHRFWGRLIGVVVLVPLLAFWATGRIERRLVPRLGVIFVLGGLQGAIGWFMVASGFSPESTAVSAYRLVAHLVMALVLFAAVLWTALSVLHPVPAAPREVGPVRAMLRLSAGMVALTIVAGGFVAGLHAGLVYNSFPLMDGGLVPAGYAQLSPWVRNLTENVAAVQFDHRLLASLTLILVTATAVVGWRRGIARGAMLALGGAVVVQYGLGVSTLLLVVPVGLATLHQSVAVLLLSAVVFGLHSLRFSKS
jgi:cytochrome c oxidase assembly protein subunit 15